MRPFLSNFPDWMAQNRLAFFRCRLIRVTQVNLVMPPLVGKVHCISLPFCKFIHLAQRLRLIVIAADVHTLDTQSFLIMEKLGSGKVHFLLPSCFFLRPVEHLLCHKFRQTNHRDPLEALFMGKIYTICIRLLPQTFQRRYDILKETLGGRPYSSS